MTQLQPTHVAIPPTAPPTDFVIPSQARNLSSIVECY
jgi:hypothetical protein